MVERKGCSFMRLKATLGDTLLSHFVVSFRLDMKGEGHYFTWVLTPFEWVSGYNTPFTFSP